MTIDIFDDKINNLFDIDKSTLKSTNKLYYYNPYISQVIANIIAIEKDKDFYKLVLDETIFYPEGGGQPSDRGEINEITVFDVKEKDGIVYHFVSELPKDTKVNCTIDFERRFDFMQQHSGEHVLSGVILKLFGGSNKGFHIGQDYVTIDINIKDMSDEMLVEAEKITNNYIFENQVVDQVLTDADGLKAYPIRKEIAVDDDIRIVSMGEADCCACCGTHVKRLGEVGLLKIIKSESYKGMTRIYFLCGKRALADYREKNDIIKSLKKELSADESMILPKIEKQKEDITQLKRQADMIRKDLALSISKTLETKTKMTFVFEDLDFITLGHLESILIEKSETVILGSTIDNKITTVTNNQDINLGQFFKNNIKTFNGKGGGSKDKAQGSFENAESLNDFYKSLISSI